MGDVGDYWNEHRDFKRAARRYWLECPSASCQFGGNPVKVAPGCKCRHCGWVAPGERGSDARNARMDEGERLWLEMETDRKKAEKKALRTCKFCNREFSTPQGRASHEKDYHKKRIDAAARGEGK